LNPMQSHQQGYDNVRMAILETRHPGTDIGPNIGNSPTSNLVPMEAGDLSRKSRWATISSLGVEVDRM
jgi:hypothetical protein